jgi:hypothetical protein
MGLTSFYKYIDNKILSLLSNKYNNKYNILICFVDGNEHYSKKDNITRIDIGNSTYFKDNIMKLNNKLEKYDIINIRFSLEYFFKNSKDLKLFIEFINEHLNKDGYLVFYIMSEKKVNSYFMRNINYIGKYKILPLYDVSDTFSSYGKEIIISENPHNEKVYIVDIDEVKLILHKYNIELLGATFFSSFVENFIKKGGTMNTDDIQTTFISNMYIFRKY